LLAYQTVYVAPQSPLTLQVASIGNDISVSLNGAPTSGMTIEFDGRVIGQNTPIPTRFGLSQIEIYSNQAASFTVIITSSGLSLAPILVSSVISLLLGLLLVETEPSLRKRLKIGPYGPSS
jgi:hypothetical protein